MVKSAVSQNNFVRLNCAFIFIALLTVSFSCNNSTKNSSPATKPWTKHTQTKTF